MRKLILFSTVLLAGCAGGHHAEPATTEATPTCATIHKPLAGCPKHWFEVPRVFTEKDGTQISACIAPTEEQHRLNLEPCMDYLLPGERAKIVIPLGPEKNIILEPPPVKKPVPHA